MSFAYIHLISNLLPILGPFFGFGVLLYGFLSRSQQVKNAAYFIFIASALGAIIAYSTGEAAEEMVENIVGISKSAIDAHEDYGVAALVSGGLLGLLSVAGILINRLKPLLNHSISVGLMVVSTITFMLTAWTGHLGGKIRHTEMGAPAGVTSERNED